MADRMHKHKGLVRSDTGMQRNHPVTQKHKDKTVQKFHNLELANFARSSKKLSTVSKPKIGTRNLGVTQKRKVQKTTNKKRNLKSVLDKVFKEKETPMPVLGCPIDKDGYISIDIDQLNVKGIRVSCIKSKNTKIANIQHCNNLVGIEITK